MHEAGVRLRVQHDALREHRLREDASAPASGSGKSSNMTDAADERAPRSCRSSRARRLGLRPAIAAEPISTTSIGIGCARRRSGVGQRARMQTCHRFTKYRRMNTRNFVIYEISSIVACSQAFDFASMRRRRRLARALLNLTTSCRPFDPAGGKAHGPVQEPLRRRPPHDRGGCDCGRHESQSAHERGASSRGGRGFRVGGRALSAASSRTR